MNPVTHFFVGWTVGLPAEKRKELRGLAKKIMRELFLDERAKRYLFYQRVCNEYFWFHELHEEQYAFGAERVAVGMLRGHYSMCVGASQLARKCLDKNDQAGARLWAERSLKAFYEFEKIDPDWHNINHFYAYALAVLGRYDEALEAYKGMYRKQKAAVNEREVAEFLKNVAHIKAKLGG